MSRNSTLSRDDLTLLEQIPNVGPSIAGCLRRIGVQQPVDLKDRDPFEMYDQLCHHDGQRYDPCVLDVFMAVTDFMSGKPKNRPWWKYTPKRKRDVARREKAKLNASNKQLGRRALLANGVLCLLATRTLPASAGLFNRFAQEKDALRFSIFTDLHYADKAPGGTRHYRETLAKLANARQSISTFGPEFVVELGDVIDAAESVDQEQQYLKTIHKQLSSLPGDNHYVLGNHCVYWLTKPEFLEVVGQQKTYYAFDKNDFHLVVLDGCFRNDGEAYGRKNFQWTDSNLSHDELEWLDSDLKDNDKPTIVFVHQRLDVEGHYGIKNAARARQILQRSGNVLAVFQGHNHKNDYNEISGIHYCTVNALVEGSGQENSAFANVIVDRLGNIQVDGFFQQKSYNLTRA